MMQENLTGREKIIGLIALGFVKSIVASAIGGNEKHRKFILKLMRLVILKQKNKNNGQQDDIKPLD